MKSPLSVLAAVVLSFGLGMALQAARGAEAQNEADRATGIGGVFFKAQNPATLAGWYRDHLGISFTPAGKGAMAPQFHAFQWGIKDEPQHVGSTAFAIFPVNSTYFGQSDAPFMINFRVANLDRLLVQLKTEGVPVDPKIDDEPNGRFSWIMDPEGHRIELWEPKGE